MPSIQLDANGEVTELHEDDGGVTRYEQGKGVSYEPGTVAGPRTNVGPDTPTDYTDEELAAALPYTNGAGSPEQAELDSMRARINFCQAKADEISSYSPEDGSPRYAVGDMERQRLLNTVKNLTSGLELQLLLSQQSLARRFLDDKKKALDNPNTLAHRDAIEKRAREIAFEREAQQLATLMIKRNIGGERN